MSPFTPENAFTSAGSLNSVFGAEASTNPFNLSEQNPYQLPSYTNRSSLALSQSEPLLEVVDNLAFANGDYNRDGSPDLFVLVKSSTSTNSTEVHVLDGSTNYQTWLLHTGTILHETGDNFAFDVGDFNGDGLLDVSAIKKSGTGTNSTEVHILDGSTNYQTWLMQTGTALHETGDNFTFANGDYNRDGRLDLFAFAKSSTRTNSTEVHVLDGSTNYQTWLLQTGTILHETGNNFVFDVGDVNSDGLLDIFSIKKSSTGTNSTEVHVLDGSTNYQTWLLQVGTVLGETGSNFNFQVSDFNRDGKLDVFSIDKWSGSGNQIEVGILDGSSLYQNWLSGENTLPVYKRAAVVEPITKRLDISEDKSVLRYGGAPIRLISYSDLGILAENAFYRDRNNFFDKLKEDGLNMVRVWLSYPWGGNDSISPFMKVRDTGDVDKDGNRRELVYDITKFNERFFQRLTTFVADAEKKGIIVQVTLFNGSELDGRGWDSSPYNPKNNINRIGRGRRERPLSSKSNFDDYSGNLWLKSHQPFIQKVADTLQNFGNVIYEIANEPEAHYMKDWKFHEKVADTLWESLKDGSGSKVISANLDDDYRNSALAKWAVDKDGDNKDSHVGLISAHYVSGLVKNTDINTRDDLVTWLRNLPKPTLLSNDGDITQFSYEQKNLIDHYDFELIRDSRRVERVNQLLRAWFADGTSNDLGDGRLGFDFLAKELNGQSWNKSDYDPRSDLIDRNILKKLGDFSL